ncbi:copper amine oxidase N-terminal domain-containing protein [Paenibacillus sp. IHBB 10380]|uniref:copper amine oxidase N-terminal domain-containing protein n=1 Tax=Paenibacillus sp. IHBB 10380 TaxID=1566358 RepID=UPI0005CFA1B4|nr:copper amine oxidase N-terminal domain-containing protein [Paenibacillus sp. IHBB 10380]AJS59731.1 hypothetical protein UB51_16000 [Paenibacillus sp. IHBB 10380]
MKRFKIGLAISMAFLLVVLAGCQAVGGLDINKALVDSLTVKSSESKQTMSLEIVPTSSDLSKEDKKMIDLLNSFSISIDHAITQDSSTGSVEGAISLDGIKLPFHLSMDKKTILLWVEGAKQPLSISLDAIEGADLSELELSNEKSLALMKDVGKFFFKNVANPAKISVASVNEKVNGEAVNLQKLHMEIHGDELVGLVKSFLTSVSKDKEGVKELIGTLYDVYYPIIETLIPMYADDYEGYYSEYKESATFGTLESIIQDKEATVIYLANQLQKSLDKLLVDYDKEVQDLFTETPELNELFGKDTVLSMDVMVDSKLNIRKQNMDLTVQIPDVEGMPIKQFKIHSTSEIWHVNEPVTVNKVDTSKGVMELDLNDMMGMTPGKTLRNFDQKSEVYRFLKEDMGIGHKYITLDTVNYADDNDDDYGYYALAFSIKNTTMVPLRYVAEQLDAQLEWDGASKTTTITEDLTGSKIVLKHNSKQALVNGASVTLAQPVTIVDREAYVPLRFITEALGATYNLNADDQYIVIERK